MAKIIPFEINYKTVNTLDRYATILLYSSTIVIIGKMILEKYQLMNELNDALVTINIFLICLYAYFDQRSLFIFSQAEMKRRVDYLDNSFGTNFSGKKSTGYYTNDNLKDGIKKLAVNCFENAHHTNFIISKMLPKAITQTIVIVVIFIGSAAIGDREIIRLIFELALPVYLINKLIKFVLYKSKISGVYDRFKALFNDVKSAELSDIKVAEVLREVLEYETTLSWASIPLDSKVFLNHQTTLATEWDELKSSYQIN